MINVIAGGLVLASTAMVLAGVILVADKLAGMACSQTSGHTPHEKADHA